MPDLWPDDFGKTEMTLPLTILREQADSLGKKTDEFVRGQVLTAPVGSYSQATGALIHHFFLVVPLFNDYMFELLTVAHEIKPYPVLITLDASVTKENKETSFKANSAEELMAHLRTIFSSDEVKDAVNVLKAQAAELATSA